MNTLLDRIKIFIRTGYWCPKYIFLSLLCEETDEEKRKMLKTGAMYYLNKGDTYFDRLYLAINDLHILKELLNEKIDGKGE